FAKKLEDALASGVAPQTAQEAQTSSVTLKLAKDAPFALPSFHGDSTVPWYDLPATTWLPHLTPNSTKPMFPDQIRPIQLAAGPADKVLVNAVQDLLGEVERMFSKEQKWNDEPGNDLNELGERVVLDEITGEVIAATAEAGVGVEAVKHDLSAQGTADHHRVHLRPSKARLPKTVHIARLLFLSKHPQRLSLLFPHQETSLSLRLLQQVTKVLGRLRRLLHIWHQAGSPLTQP
uniref:Uncharacterized protein n=1 Tax=Fusarium oxysporum (strain Fo5176) TaxID=660025 RepID=A0A0D2XUG4_FUSOF